MELIHVHNLYTATKIRVASARQACRTGNKDEARRDLNFIRNANIIQIIKGTSTDNCPGLEMNWSLLEWQLSELEQECHPSTAPVLTNDLAKISNSLEVIASGVAKLLQKP